MLRRRASTIDAAPSGQRDNNKQQRLMPLGLGAAGAARWSSLAAVAFYPHHRAHIGATKKMMIDDDGHRS